MSTALETLFTKYPDAKARCEQRAKEADAAADDMYRATNSDAFKTAKETYEKAREDLLEALLSLSDIAALWTANGLGLLSGTTTPAPSGAAGPAVEMKKSGVADVLHQTDPSLYGLYRAVKDDESAENASAARAEFECAIEACLFVYPDRSPLYALLTGCDRLCRVSSDDKYRDLIKAEAEKLQQDDVWVPQDTSSTEGFLKEFVESGQLPAAVDEETLRDTLKTYEWQWAKLRDTLKVADQDLLRSIISFRRELTRNLIEKARANTRADAIKRYGNRFRWTGSTTTGSANLSSDYAVSLDGPAAETVVKEFNRLFRGWTRGEVDPDGEPRTGYAGPAPKWELEAAYVFNVNVHANENPRNRRRGFLGRDVSDPDFRPRDKDKRAKADAFFDVYALLKIRRHAEKEDWDEFSKELLAALSPKHQDATKALLGQVEPLWTTLKGKIDKQADAVRAKYAGMPAENVAARAENELYQAQLDVVEGIRQNGGKPLDDDARLRLAEQQALAGVYARETVRGVVAKPQQSVRLSFGDVLRSVNGQIGDLFNEIGRVSAALPVAQHSSDLDLSITSSQSMVRLGNAALALNYRIVHDFLEQQLTVQTSARQLLGMTDSAAGRVQVETWMTADTLLEVQTLCLAWRETASGLLEIKSDEDKFKEGNAWNKDATDRIKAAPWRQAGHSDAKGPIGELRRLLIALAAAANAQYREKLKSRTVALYLKELLASSRRWAAQQGQPRAEKPAETQTTQLAENGAEAAPSVGSSP